MSVTVADLLKLPSLRRARVLGGRGGLTRIVSSVSVLESANPDVLVEEIFPQDKYSGGELVITGFLNCTNDVDLQLANMKRLIDGGEAGLVLYYVGVHLPRVDRRLIDLADASDFVLISMPEGQRNLRYSDLISDVTECIYRDRSASISLVSDILARMSSLPHHQQTVRTAVQILSEQLSSSVLLATGEGKILNLACWPSGTEEAVRKKMERNLPMLPSREGVPSSFLPDTTVFCLPIRSDAEQEYQLILFREGASLNPQLIEQAADTVRICVNIWGRRHGAVAIHELLRSILQDEPLKMRRLAEIFHIDVASLHEIWILFGIDSNDAEEILEQSISLGRECADTAVGAIFEDRPVISLSTPQSLRDTEVVMHEMLENALAKSENAVIVRCGGLPNTTSCRRAYLLTLENLEYAKRIFPKRRLFQLGDLEFTASCRKRIGEGESAAARRILPLSALQSDKEYQILLQTACTYLLDCDCSITRTAESLFVHKNTIKYRLQRIGDLLGYRIGKMPEMTELYKSAAIYRLLNDAPK